MLRRQSALVSLLCLRQGSIRIRSASSFYDISLKPVVTGINSSIATLKHLRSISSCRTDLKTDKQSVPDFSDKFAIDKHLAYIHALLEWITPQFMVRNCTELISILAKDVVFQDALYNYQKSGVKEFMYHIAKVRAYFHIKSPFKKTEDRFDTSEGALEFQINEEGKAAKIINRQLTEDDRKQAEQFEKLREKVKETKEESGMKR